MRYVWNYREENHASQLALMIGSARRLSIICPYMREDQIEKLFGERDLESLRVITLWDVRAFLMGASQPEALKLLLRLGAEVRAMRSGLHAKVYLADDSSAVVTSANLSAGGMAGNLECGVAIDGREAVSHLVQRFDLEWRRATPLTEDHVDDLLSHLDRRKIEWDELLQNLEDLERKVSPPSTSPPSVWTQHTDDIVVELTPDQEEYLNRPIRGQGGYQSFLTRLQDNMAGNLLRLSRADCEKVVRYATQYGEGGFQGRLRFIVQLAAQFID